MKVLVALAVMMSGCVATTPQPVAQPGPAPDGPPGEVIGSDPPEGSAPDQAAPEPSAADAPAPGDSPDPHATTPDPPPSSTDVPAGLSPMERGVAEAIGRLRRDPHGLVAALTRHRARYRGKELYLPGMDGPIITFEGVKAVDEAIRAARAASPRPRLRISAGLSRSAHQHAVEIGRAGTIEHMGRDGSTPEQRMERQGRVGGLSGEDIGTGYGGADVMVLSLFIDDGVPDRGHRDNLLEPDYRVVGVGCAPHARWGTVCVLDFASSFDERR